MYESPTGISTEKIADWWLSEFSSLLQAHDAEVRGKVERLPIFQMSGDTQISNIEYIRKYQVLSLLSQDRESKKETE